MMLAPIELLPVNVVQLLMLFVSVLAIAMLRGQHRYSGLLLAFLVQALAVLFNFLEELRFVPVLVTPAMSLAGGPSLYLFVRVLVRPEQPLVWRDAVHFVPALVALFFASHIGWALALGALSQLIYLKLSLVLLLRYERAIKERRADTERLQLRWLMWLLFTLMGLIVIEIVRANLQPFLPYELRNQWYFIDQVILLLLLASFLVGIIRQPEVFDDLREFEEAEKANTQASNEQALSLFTEIDSLVKTEELFLKPRLALQDIASLTGLNAKDISWAINQGGQTSFADYINQLRIAQVVEMAQSQPQKSLLDIALDAGFSSKSSFNAVFKKQTGMPPSRYLKSLES